MCRATRYRTHVAGTRTAIAGARNIAPAPIGMQADGSLRQEINIVKGEVGEGLWEAIHAVREIGIMGSHMEKDTGLIADVDTDEAPNLIELVELYCAGPNSPASGRHRKGFRVEEAAQHVFR